MNAANKVRQVLRVSAAHKVRLDHKAHKVRLVHKAHKVRLDHKALREAQEPMHILVL